mgnify:CR=1 FL=1
MATEIRYHRTDDDKIKECVKNLRGHARLNVASHGTYFSLTIDTCLAHEVSVFSRKLEGYPKCMTLDSMNEIAAMLKKSRKWKFIDETL